MESDDTQDLLTKVLKETEKENVEEKTNDNHELTWEETIVKGEKEMKDIIEDGY